MTSSAIGARELPRSGLAVSELGFGGAAVGNLYQAMTNEAARATIDAAYDAGLCYFDTAPFYGFGLSERRIGDALRGRGDVVISTKVGRLLKPIEQPTPGVRHGFASPMPFEPAFDYSYDGILKSWEASLQRLGLARIDILLVHDIGRLTHGARYDETFAQLTRGGGLRALAELRAGGAIRAFGLGVNEWEVACDVMDHADLDIVLLAGRYTLIEQAPLARFLPQCLAREIGVVIGGPYNSGILATGTRGPAAPFYDYAPAPPAIVERVRAMEAVCDRHGVALPAAALQFPLAHPAVVGVIPGLPDPARVRETVDLYRAPIPDAFWADLRAEALLPPDAPVPQREAA